MGGADGVGSRRTGAHGTRLPQSASSGEAAILRLEHHPVDLMGCWLTCGTGLAGHRTADPPELLSQPAESPFSGGSPRNSFVATAKFVNVAVRLTSRPPVCQQVSGICHGKV